MHFKEPAPVDAVNGLRHDSFDLPFSTILWLKDKKRKGKKKLFHDDLPGHVRIT